MNTVSPNQPNPYAPPTADVGDASDHDAGAELAGRGERLGAYLLDLVIGLVIVGAPLMVGMNWDAAAAGNWEGAFTAVGAILCGIGSLVYIAITAYLVYKNGQTIGKKIVGIKVVRSDRSRASVARIFWLRNFVNGIPGAIPYIGNIYGLVDALFIFSESRQCIHDKIADTVVVKA
ncbi:MAG TPA: RDD family protein [Steroidobacteraceae bacterium]|nr:RDD family protein [Steroidobacteraceae bacterium]